MMILPVGAVFENRAPVFDGGFGVLFYSEENEHAVFAAICEGIEGDEAYSRFLALRRFIGIKLVGRDILKAVDCDLGEAREGIEDHLGAKLRVDQERVQIIRFIILRLCAIYDGSAANCGAARVCVDACV